MLLNKKESFYIDTGTRLYSGTGKNRKMTINVDQGNNYDFLPIDIGKITSVSGKNIIFSGESLFQLLYNQFKKYFEYRVYLEDIPEATVLFTGKDSSKILGAVFSFNSGHLVALPYIFFNPDKYIEYKGNEGGEEIEAWNEDALILGSHLTKNLLVIDKNLKQESAKTPEPVWVSNNNYCIGEELKISEDINNHKNKIMKIKEKMCILENKLNEEIKLKDLLYEQGKPLENAIIKALKILGYEAENFDDGELEMDQVIISPEKYRYIGECEGKDNKAININKFRQLVDCLNADFNREDVDEKAFGILFGNPERLKDPKERSLGFTEKCKKGAVRERIALIKTIDLFKVAKYLYENNDENFKKKCREAIHSYLGKIVIFPDLPDNNYE